MGENNFSAHIFNELSIFSFCMLYASFEAAADFLFLFQSIKNILPTYMV
jgi:hypothetical protein